jgi:ABC-2 type transport system ATP-binding protein
MGRGRLVADVSTAEFLRRAGGDGVRVRSPRAAELAGLLAGPDVTVESAEAGVLLVRGVPTEVIGDRAATAGIALHELTAVQASLEEAFMALTADDREYRTEEQPA